MSAPGALPGRAAELALLARYLERAVAGDQQLVLLEGDPGIGKTALLQAFARMHGRRSLRAPRVFYLHAPDDEAYRPVHHSALAATSRRMYLRVGGERQATEMARSLGPGWLGAIPVWGSLLAALAATADAVRRVRRSGRPGAPATLDEDIEALLAAARRRPLVLLLDQLERADARAVYPLERLIRDADENARILIVGAYRPTAPGLEDPPVHAMIRRLPQHGELFAYRRLGPLAPEAAAELVRRRFPGAQVPAPLVEWLVRAAGGHPGTLNAALAHLQAQGQVRRTRSGWHFETDSARLRLPAQEQSFADLDALDPAIAEVVRAAAGLGERFHAAALCRLLGRDELAVEDQLALAAHYGVLVNLGERALEDGDVTTAFRFASPHLHAALRAVAAETSHPTGPASEPKP